MPLLIAFPQFAISDQDTKSIATGVKAQDVVYVQGSEVVGPAGGTVLVSFNVPQGYKGHVVAVEVLAEDANEFSIEWTSSGNTMTKKIYAPTPGYYMIKFPLPPTINAPADSGTAISLKVVNSGGSASKYYAAMWIALV